MVRVNTLKVLGEEVEVWVSHSGYFTLHYPPVAEEITSPTRPSGDRIIGSYSYDELIKHAKPLIRAARKRVAVPFLTAEGYGAVAKGFHGRSRDKLLVWIDDPSSQYNGQGRNAHLDTWRLHRGQVLKPDTPLSAIERRTKLVEAKRKLDALIQKWDEKYGFDLRGAVQDALKELETTGSEED